MLVPYKDTFDVILSNAFSPHSHHKLTLKLTVDLVKIDAPMYSLSELEDRELGTCLDDMLVRG
ncbi:hypothetical protein DSO57_1031794 [Entomophthora muscae]|uniref:Uncharacterized protein n=1 Tax=Entomophthora muscae TaxID=34485 RepID=A0ACC2T0I7_9FUNG|nr:hypothetical protein DSO57_1031794 [Entomophthora muscae]